MGSESKSGVGLGEVSPGTRKMIQNLKEIVRNSPDSEIYAVLKECNMDPDEAVQRLLSQDTFHEVKSKRERRKEMKETHELRPRVPYSGPTRGIRSASERNMGWSGLIQACYEENGNVAHKGDNVVVASSPSYAHLKGETINLQPSFSSDSLNTDSRGQSIGTGEVNPTTLQPSSGYWPAWSGTSTGRLSMADVVRLGRPASMCSQISSDTSYTHQDTVTTNSDHFYEKPSQVLAPTQAEFYHDLHSNNACNVSGMINKSDITVGQNDFLDEQPVVEQPTAASFSSISEASVHPESEMCQSNFYGNGSESSRCVDSEIIQASEARVTHENISSDNIISAYASNRQKIITNAVGASHSDDSETGSGSNLSNPSYSAALNENDAVAAKLQHLSLRKDDPENNSTLVLPSHLKALAADCSHLSFGTYKSGNNIASTGLLPSNQIKDDLQEASTTLNGFLAGRLETRNIGYDADESIGYNSLRAIGDARNYDSQPESVKQDVSGATVGSEFINPSLHEYNVIERSTSELSFTRTEPNPRNISVDNERQLSAEHLSRLVTHISLKASKNPQAQFRGTQSMTSRHSHEPPISSPIISFSEARQPPSVLPQHRVAHSYSQPTLPLEQPSNNMIGYSGLPQSHSRLPSSFEQAYAGGDEFQRSLANLEYNLPDSEASMSSRFPRVSATGYGSYGTSNNAPGSYLHASSASPMIANSSYADAFHPAYNNGNHFTPLQQNRSSSTWNHGLGSRTLPAVQESESAYYNLLGQNQQYAGYRQGQQPSQYYGALEYSDLYRSQLGMTREHQQHNFGSMTNGGTHDPSSQQLYQLHQFWQQNH